MKKKQESTRQIQTKRIFSDEFKKQIVRDIETNRLRIVDVCRLYNVSDSAVYKWIYKFSGSLSKGTRVVIEQDSEFERSKRLMKHIADLERALGQKQLEKDVLEKMIELASEQFGVDIKKNFGGQS